MIGSRYVLTENSRINAIKAMRAIIFAFSKMNLAKHGTKRYQWRPLGNGRNSCEFSRIWQGQNVGDAAGTLHRKGGMNANDLTLGPAAAEDNYAEPEKQPKSLQSTKRLGAPKGVPEMHRPGVMVSVVKYVMAEMKSRAARSFQSFHHY